MIVAEGLSQALRPLKSAHNFSLSDRAQTLAISSTTVMPPSIPALVQGCRVLCCTWLSFSKVHTSLIVLSQSQSSIVACHGECR